MKFTASRDALLQRLQVVTRATGKGAVVVLTGVLLEATKDGIRFSATDQEIGLQVWLGQEVEEEGSLVLPGKLFLDVIKSLPKDTVNLEYDPKKRSIDITSGSASFSIRTLAKEEFPKLPTLDGMDSVALDAPAFINTIERVAPSASRDETRPILTGVLVDVTGGNLTMVATDSYRLAVKHTELASEVSDFKCVVPGRALMEISKILTAYEADTVSVALSEKQVIFTTEGVGLSSRLIEGQYPNYKQLIPEGHEHEVLLNKNELLDTVSRMGILAQSNAPLRFHFTDGKLTISSETPDLGKAQEEMVCDFQGEELEIGFNPHYLKDGLAAAGSDQVLLKLINNLKPGLLQPNVGTSFLYLIMPIRLGV